MAVSTHPHVRQSEVSEPGTMTRDLRTMVGRSTNAEHRAESFLKDKRPIGAYLHFKIHCTPITEEGTKGRSNFAPFFARWIKKGYSFVPLEQRTQGGSSETYLSHIP